MKNKKILFTIITLVVIVAVIVTLNVVGSVKITIQLKDSYNNTIEDYGDNKMPFMIVANNDNQSIRVNGKKYNGERLYNPGTYIITVREGVWFKNYVAKINKIERSATSEYSIYLTSETLQLLFVGMEMVEKEGLKGFLWTKKDTTLNLQYLQERSTDLRISKNIGNIEEKQIREGLVPEVKEYIKEILQKDENAYFHLYIDEYRFYLEQEFFCKLGLSDDRYDVTIYSDGTLSYVEQYYNGTTYFYREYPIREPEAYELFLEEKEEYARINDGIRSNTLEYSDVQGIYFIHSKKGLNYNYLLISTLRDNVRYMLQYPELITFEDSKVAEEMKAANLDKIVAVDEYNKIGNENKDVFFKIVNLDKETLDKEYFKDETAKYLIVTGTKPFYGKIGKDSFESIMKQVCNEYKEYTILYKPHPSALPVGEEQELLEDLNIKILPGKLPMETIMFIYPNIKLGGYPSSLYLSADPGKTEFFFAEGIEDLVAPLDQLYDKMFATAKFYTK